MCLHFYLVLFEQVGYSMFLVQYRKVFSDQYNFFERVDLAFALFYVYCVLRSKWHKGPLEQKELFKFKFSLFHICVWSFTKNITSNKMI